MAKFDGIQNRTLTSQEASTFAALKIFSGQAIDQQLQSRRALRALMGKSSVKGTKLVMNARGEESALAKLRPKHTFPVDSREVEWAIQFGRQTGADITVATSTDALTTSLTDLVREGHFYVNYRFFHTEWSKLMDLWKGRKVSQREVDLKVHAMMEGVFDAMETDLFRVEATPSSLGVPSETAMSCLDYITSDGLTAAERTTYYGTAGLIVTNADNYAGTVDDAGYQQYIVDISATGNEPARSIVRKPGTNLTPTIVKQYARMLGNNGADVDNLVLWCNETQYDALDTAVTGTGTNLNIVTDYKAKQAMEFGLAEFMCISGVLVASDRNIASTRSYMLDMSRMAVGFDILDSTNEEATHLNFAKTTKLVCGNQVLTDRKGSHMKILF